MKFLRVLTGYWLLRFLVAAMRVVPVNSALAFGRFLGNAAYALSPKSRNQVLAHIRVALGRHIPAQAQERLARDFFRSFGMNMLEIARLPLVARQGFADYVEISGREHVDAAIKKGHGVIFLSIHSGNWELSNLVGSMCGHPYNMVANDMARLDRIGEMIKSLRQSGGAKVIHPGIGGREIIRCLKRNEIVTLVADQGGRDGILLPFLGREASLSTGAVRLALKYEAQIILVNIHRVEGSRHKLEVVPFTLTSSGDEEKDITENMTRMAIRFEEWVLQHPCEYLWIYKTWKHSRFRSLLVLDDGRTGHLRQSQAVASAAEKLMRARGYVPERETVTVKYRSDSHARFLALLGACRLIPVLNPSWLFFFFSRETVLALLSFKPYYVIACGSKTAPLNCWLAGFNRAQSFHVLRPGAMPLKAFSFLTMPRHDARGKSSTSGLFVSRGALNLVDADYMAFNQRGLVRRFPHLDSSYRPKIGFLLGGDVKGCELSVHQVQLIIHQIKDVLDRYHMNLLLTTSRRTSRAVELLLLKEFDHDPRCRLMVLASRADVPEAIGGILALSDLVLVSADSISMVSEAVSSGKKVVAFPVDGPSLKPVDSKHVRFVEDLAQEGYVALASTTQVAAVIEDVLKNKIPTRALRDSSGLSLALEKHIR